MDEGSTIGLDIAKSVFQVHGIDVAGSVVIRNAIAAYIFGFQGLAAVLTFESDPELLSARRPSGVERLLSNQEAVASRSLRTLLVVLLARGASALWYFTCSINARNLGRT